MNEFLKIIFGNQTLAGFAGNMILAIVGILVKLQWDANKRDANSPSTPVDFSFAFLLKDNALRLFSSFAFSLFIVYIAVRFTDQLLHVELNPFVALLIGLGSDSIASLLKDLTKSIPSFTNIQTTVTDDTGIKKIIDTSIPAIEQAVIKEGAITATESVVNPAAVIVPDIPESQTTEQAPVTYTPNFTGVVTNGPMSSPSGAIEQAKQ